MMPLCQNLIGQGRQVRQVGKWVESIGRNQVKHLPTCPNRPTCLTCPTCPIRHQNNQWCWDGLEVGDGAIFYHNGVVLTLEVLDGTL